jgi:hypothetical protein
MARFKRWLGMIPGAEYHKHNIGVAVFHVVLWSCVALLMYAASHGG